MAETFVIAFFVFAALFLMPSLVMFGIVIRRNKVCSAEEQAKIMAINEVYTSGGVDYYPELRFYAEGIKVKEEVATSIDTMKYKVGDEITVMYEPGNPRNFFIKGLGNHANLVIGAILFALAVFFAAIGVITILTR